MNIPNICPSCSGKILITELCCSDCKTRISGSFEFPLFAALSDEEIKFLKVFLTARGSIKGVEHLLGISYPTVRARLEVLLNKLGLGDLGEEERQGRLAVVGRLERGEISVSEAVVLLRDLEK